jgi:hypothetical protein
LLLLLLLLWSCCRHPFGDINPAFFICSSSDALSLSAKHAKRLPAFCFSAAAADMPGGTGDTGADSGSASIISSADGAKAYSSGSGGGVTAAAMPCGMGETGADRSSADTDHAWSGGTSGISSADGGSAKSRRARAADIQLGLALDKQLCFHGVTSIAVLGNEQRGLQLAFAGLTVAMRETHRYAGS